MSIKILLADDSITIQKVIGIIFGGEEYALTVVDNGKAALDRAIETTPDILLIDALMPGMSGYEVCERIRATPELAAKPILLLTGSFEPFDETKARECGADDFIAKPFESQQIIAKVTELCERSALRSFEALQSPPPAAPAPLEPQSPPPAVTQESILPANDIWDAFTTAPAAPPPEAITAPLAEQEQPPFAPQEAEPVASPWVPIDEQSFQFEEETAADLAPATYGESSPANEFSFAETTFAENPPTTAKPVIPPSVAPVVSAEFQQPAPAAVLTEEQVRIAIASLSRDVIERVVWEVVPDLAESMIREAIRRIKEGVH